MANILVNVEKDVEVGAEHLLAFLTKAQSNAPKALAALGVLATAAEKAVGDVSADAANPLNIVIDAAQAADFTAAFADLKSFLTTLGIKL